ncbi:3088_t:CDS:2 [Entrophospora sp. SA101]|nr:3088_t:CDS:2 [Entrophospora sp. SA101]
MHKNPDTTTLDDPVPITPKLQTYITQRNIKKSNFARKSITYSNTKTHKSSQMLSQTATQNLNPNPDSMPSDVTSEDADVNVNNGIWEYKKSNNDLLINGDEVVLR